MAKELTARQQRFAQEYVIDLNGTRAAIAAGASRANARPQASRWLTKANIRTEIARLQAGIAAKLEISATELTKRLKQFAFFDIRRLYNEDGSLKRIVDLDDDTAAAVSGVVEKLFKRFAQAQAEEIGSTIKVKMVDPVRACEHLGRHIPGFFQNGNKVGVNVGVSIADRIAARKRVAEHYGQK